MSKKGKSGVVVIFDPIAFQEKGFDGEIGQYMLHHKNTALVGKENGLYGLTESHVVEFDSWADLREYERKLNA